MKKALSIALALIMMLSLSTACGSKDTPTSDTPDAPTSDTPVADTPADSEEDPYAHIEQTPNRSNVPIEQDGPLGRYPETITLTFSKDRWQADEHRWEKMLKVGETMEDNRYTRGFLEHLNINVEYAWIVDGTTYDQRLQMAISAGDIPDVLKIPLHMRTSLMQLAEEGMVWALDDAWEEYVSPLAREIFDADGGLARRSVGYNGQMMALPSMTASIHLTPHFWVRTDWMEQLGWQDRFGEGKLMTPDEWFEYITLANEADLNGDGSTVYGMTLSGRRDAHMFWDQLEGMFVGFDAYPVQWIDMPDGSLAWGSIQPEMLEPLKFVKKVYDAGLIHPEWVTHDDEDVKELIASGQISTGYVWHWAPYLGMEDCKINFPGSDWKPYETPTTTGELAKRRYELGIRYALAVSKNCEYPEAVIKMMNLYSEWLFGPGADVDYFSNPYIDGDRVENVWYFGPLDQLTVGIDTDNTVLAVKAHNGEIDPSELSGWALNYYETSLKEWPFMAMFGPEGACLQQVRALADPANLLKVNHFVGPPTETMVSRWSSLWELTNTFTIQAILGDIDIDSGFEEYVNNWYAMGGEDITREVNEWYNQNR